MPRLIATVGVEFGTNQMNIVLGGETHNFTIPVSRVDFTAPYKGAVLGEEDIRELIIFLQQQLGERKR